MRFRDGSVSPLLIPMRGPQSLGGPVLSAMGRALKLPIVLSGTVQGRATGLTGCVLGEPPDDGAD